MNRSTFTLILIALATIGYSQGDSSNEHYDLPHMSVEKPEMYDTFQEHMNDFVNKNTHLISTRSFDDLEESESITTGDEENCVAVTTVKTPYEIKTNVSSEIVIQLDNFKQRIRETRCKNAGSTCFGMVNTPGYGLETICKEKYGSVSLYIYDPRYGQFRYKPYPVPVCCSCVFRSTMKK